MERDFLVDIAVAVGVRASTALRKYELLDAIHNALYGTGMPSAYLSRGGTVTNAALSKLLQGWINKSGRTVPADQLRDALADLDDEERRSLAPNDDDARLSEERRKALRLVLGRPAQAAFRQALITQYNGTCIITGESEPRTLDAAHITPFASGGSNQTANGILLRADLHRLWDAGGIAVHEVSYRVLVHASVMSNNYGRLVGLTAKIPVALRTEEQRRHFKAQREWAGL